MASPPTLLIFTLGPARERARRRLLPTAEAAREVDLHRACLVAAVAAGREAGCRLLAASPRPLEVGPEVHHRPQRGRTFGQRLRNAVRSAGDGGPLVVVGTDSPGLAAGHVRQALALLDDDPDRVVVGPSADGGFYLLAARRPLGRVLARVRWRRSETLRSLLAALAAEGRPVRLLAPLADIDRRADLERWLTAPDASGKVWRRLVGALRELLARFCRAATPLGVRAPRRLALADAGRGPPA